MCQIFVKKASRQLNVLKRIGTHLTKLGKHSIYYSFIMSNFNYCPLVWHFCGETNTKKIEKIQERALRFIYNEYTSSYEPYKLFRPYDRFGRSCFGLTQIRPYIKMDVPALSYIYAAYGKSGLISNGKE